ncbi:MAG: SBBP repeat-containing protein [Chitinophagales bacterium]|nr:SBBP repeat-containing protein [Chitinophagales bacterium]
MNATLKLLAILFCLSRHCFAIDTSFGDYNESSIAFAENKGQVTDQDFRKRKDIDFKLKAGNGLSVFVGNGALHYQFYQADTNSQNVNNFNSAPADIESPNFNMYRLDVALIGANPSAEIIKEGKQAYQEYYYTAGIDAPNQRVSWYEKITYKNIYHNIDWVLSVAAGQLKQEFVVRDGGNVADIRLRYAGHKSLLLKENGKLAVTTPLGVITEDAPFSFIDDGSSVNCAYKLTDDILSYTIGDYSGILTIDPAVTWSTYFGADAPTGFGLIADSSGAYIYLGGTTYCTQNIATSGSHQQTFGGNVDAFIAKFNTSGFPVWGTYLGGAGLDYGADAAISYYNAGSSGNHYIYLAGYTRSKTNMSTQNVYKSTLSGLGDGFISKFTDSGKLVWSTYYGGQRDDRIYCMSTDTSGKIYVGGYSYSWDSIATLNAYQVTGDPDSASLDGMIAQFNDSGQLQWGTYYGGDSAEIVTNIACGINAIYFSGQTRSKDSISSPGASQPALYNKLDCFVGKFTTSGTRLWATYLGGEELETPTSLALDSKGNVYVCGSTTSKLNIATGGSHKSQLNGTEGDGFLAKYNTNGQLQWSTYYGGDDADVINTVAIDYFDDIYVGGASATITGLTTPNALQISYGGGGYDGILSKFDASGAELWTSYFGGNGSDVINSIAINKLDIFIGGGTGSSNGIASQGAYKSTLIAATDGFVALVCDTTLVFNAIYGAHELCLPGTDTLVSYYKNGNWLSVNGKVYIDSSGFITAISTGVDTILRLATNTCGTDTARHVITVHTSPITMHPATLANMVGETAKFSVTTTGSNNSFQWQMDNGAGFQNITNSGQYSGATSNILTITNLTTLNSNQRYRCLVAGDLCDAISDAAELLVWPSSVNEVAATCFVFSPNPANDVITIVGPHVLENIRVYNLMGQVVIFENADTNQAVLNIQNLSKGVYMLQVNGEYGGKLVKQ